MKIVDLIVWEIGENDEGAVLGHFTKEELEKAPDLYELHEGFPFKIDHVRKVYIYWKYPKLGKEGAFPATIVFPLVDEQFIDTVLCRYENIRR